MSLLLVFAALAASAPPMPEGPALRASIEARDAELFELFFQGCDPTRLRPMLADDVEFYHDKGGFVFRNAEAMVADYAKQCAERAKPDSWRSRRELVTSSLIVDPVPGYGAMEAGDHLFYGASMPVMRIVRSPSRNVSPSMTQAGALRPEQAVNLAATTSVAPSGPTGPMSLGSSRAPATTSTGTANSAKRMSRRCGLNDGVRRVGLKRLVAIELE